jgi:hypothetical protein
MDIKELKDTINSNITFQRELIDRFILDCPIEEQVALMKIIRDMKWSSILSIMETYIKERVGHTVHDIVKRKDFVMFECRGTNFSYAGLVNNEPVFKIYGQEELIPFPFDFNDQATKIF